jgi:hypothetical protein
MISLALDTPGDLQVIRRVRLQYACSACDAILLRFGNGTAYNATVMKGN